MWTNERTKKEWIDTDRWSARQWHNRRKVSSRDGRRRRAQHSRMMRVHARAIALSESMCPPHCRWTCNARWFHSRFVLPEEREIDPFLLSLYLSMMVQPIPFNWVCIIWWEALETMCNHRHGITLQSCTRCWSSTEREQEQEREREQVDYELLNRCVSHGYYYFVVNASRSSDRTSVRWRWDHSDRNTARSTEWSS